MRGPRPTSCESEPGTHPPDPHWRPAIQMLVPACRCPQKPVPQERQRRPLGADTRADLLEREGCPVEQDVERCGQARVSFANPFRGCDAGASIAESRAGAGPRPPRSTIVFRPWSASSTICRSNKSACVADWLPIERSCSLSTRALSSASGKSWRVRPCRRGQISAARSNASPCRFSFSLLLSNPSAMGQPACCIVAELHQQLCHCRQLGAAVVMRLDSTCISASRDWASLRILITEF